MRCQLSSNIIKFKPKSCRRPSILELFTPTRKPPVNILFKMLTATNAAKNMTTDNQIPITGDFLKVAKDTYPGYEVEVFKVVGYIHSPVAQLCIEPVLEQNQGGRVWVMYDPSIHKRITDKRYLELFNALF